MPLPTLQPSHLLLRHGCLVQQRMLQGGLGRRGCNGGRCCCGCRARWRCCRSPRLRLLHPSQLALSHGR